MDKITKLHAWRRHARRASGASGAIMPRACLKKARPAHRQLQDCALIPELLNDICGNEYEQMYLFFQPFFHLPTTRPSNSMKRC